MLDPIPGVCNLNLCVLASSLVFLTSILQSTLLELTLCPVSHGDSLPLETATCLNHCLGNSSRLRLPRRLPLGPYPYPWPRLSSRVTLHTCGQVRTLHQRAAHTVLSNQSLCPNLSIYRPQGSSQFAATRTQGPLQGEHLPDLCVAMEPDADLLEVKLVPCDFRSEVGKHVRFSMKCIKHPGGYISAELRGILLAVIDGRTDLNLHKLVKRDLAPWLDLIQAIGLDPKEPELWASGLRSAMQWRGHHTRLSGNSLREAGGACVCMCVRGTGGSRVCGKAGEGLGGRGPCFRSSARLSVGARCDHLPLLGPGG